MVHRAAYVFLSPGGSHYRRSSYGERYFRPAADGWYPDRAHRSARPVLIDASGLYPGLPLPAWPAAVAGETFVPPAGRGVARFISDPRTGHCQVCRRAFPRRLDGMVVAHTADGNRCPGSGQEPGEDVAVASWLPVSMALTPHGLRHGLKTSYEDQIADVLKSERLGHEEPGMRGVYGHVSPSIREELKGRAASPVGGLATPACPASGRFGRAVARQAAGWRAARRNRRPLPSEKRTPGETKRERQARGCLVTCRFLVGVAGFEPAASSSEAKSRWG